MEKMQNGLCPCGSGKNYGECCQLCHEGQPAKSAEALMRSRYSAYALGFVDYIVKTTHPDHPDSKRPEDVRRKEIEEFCKTTVFKGLKLLEIQEGETKGVVKFTVYLFMDGKDFSFTEKSTFEKVLGKWLYLKGDLTA
jgi:SEC-C motif-containing protein